MPKNNPQLLIIEGGKYHIAVFKPHNMAVVGGRGVVRPTLLDLVREKFGQQVFAVHRLDRATCGITIFAKGIFAKHALENAFKKRLVKKDYYALVEGNPDFKKKTVELNLKKEGTQKPKGPVAMQSVKDEGEYSKTNFECLKKIQENLFLLKACPITGRMHQIRIHLAHLGLPIIGDSFYGAKSKLPKQVIGLCAVKIEFPMPKGGKAIIDATKFFDLNFYLSNLKESKNKAEN